MYAALKDYEDATKWFSFEPHMHFLPWRLRLKHSYDSLFVKDQRYKALLRKMNLPDPAPFQYDPDLVL
jgi:hypothetical protein